MNAAIVILFKTFCMVFLAELGDKTQLTTLAAAADAPSLKKWVLIGSALALVTSSVIAVCFGCAIQKIISPKNIQIASGFVFLIFGVITLWGAFK